MGAPKPAPDSSVGVGDPSRVQLIVVGALWLQDAIATIISFAAIGIYVAFQMIVVGALVATGVI